MDFEWGGKINFRSHLKIHRENERGQEVTFKVMENIYIGDFIIIGNKIGWVLQIKKSEGKTKTATKIFGNRVPVGVPGYEALCNIYKLKEDFTLELVASNFGNNFPLESYETHIFPPILQMGKWKFSEQEAFKISNYLSSIEF